MKSALRLPLAASAALTALALGACGQDAPAPQPSIAATASAQAATQAASTQAASGVRASDGVLVLPAVKGRPGAAYFMVSNTSDTPATVSGVSIEGAGKSEMHETMGGKMAPLPKVEVLPRQMVMFERGGKHVMVFGLDPAVKAGDTVQMTLAFADGGKLAVPLQVESAGGATSHEAEH